MAFSRVVLLTGTGVMPPDDFALAPGDLITIDITGIGQLVNRVGQREPGIDCGTARQ